MGSIRDDIRQAFSRGNSSSVQLILINLFVFIGIFSVKLILSMAPETKEIVPAIDRNLLLSTDLSVFTLHPWALLTFGFTNGSILNLLFNSIALYWFGLLVQDFIGNRKLINIYFLGYVFAGIFYILLYHVIALSQTAFNMTTLVYGSNAAVYAVMFATVTLIPDYEFNLLRRFYIKIKYIAVLFLVISFINPSFGLLNLGGAFLGYLYIKLLRLGVDLGSPIETFTDWLGGLKGSKSSSRKYQSKKFSHSTVGKPNAYQMQEENDFLPDQEEVDSLLDKISVSGYESLSKQEKERLFLASKSQKL